MNENIQMNHFYFICKIYLPSRRYSVLVGVLLVFIWQISEFWSSSYSSNIVNLILQNFVPTKLNNSLYWKELFVQKEYFCNLSFLFANMKYLYCQVDEASKKNFFIVYWAYIYLFLFIILFLKSKTTKISYLIKYKVFERIKHLK